MPAVSERLRNILADILSVPPDQIGFESSPETIASWDSFAHLQVILAIESEFGIRFDPLRAPHLASVASLQQELESKDISDPTLKS